MERSIADKTVDILLNRRKKVMANISTTYKHTKPFRQEPVDSHQTVYDANMMSPEMEQSLRQSFGDAVIDEYKLKAQQAQARLG